MKKLVSISFAVVFCILFTDINTWAQALNDYRSAASGDWNSRGTWQRFNGTTWITPTVVQGTPNNNDGVITIRSPHTVTVTANVTVDQVIIEFGGKVIITNNDRWTIANGSGTDLTVNGTVVNSDEIRLNTSATASFSSGSTYRHSQSGGTIPKATWDANSTCELTIWASSDDTPGGIAGQTFGHFKLGPFTDGGNNTGALSTNDATITCAGNFTVDVGGSDGRPIALTTGNDDVILNVKGNFVIQSGTFYLGTADGNGTINIGGNFSQSASTTLSETGSGTYTLTFNGIGDQTFTESGTLSNTINFTVNKTIGNVVLNSNLQINGAATLTMTRGNIDLNSNSLTLGTGSTNQTRGTLNRGPSAGFLTGVGTVTGWFSGSNISIGNIQGLFPMGSGTINRSVWFGGDPSTGGTISVQHANHSGNSIVPEFEDYGITIDRRHNMNWTLSTANGFYVTNARLRIQGSGIPGISVVADIRLINFSSAVGISSNGMGNTTNPQANRIGLTTANLNNTFYFGSNSGSNAMPVELSSFTASLKGESIILNWITKTEVNNYGFEIERSTEGGSLVVGSWKKIGFIEGNGNSNSEKEYEFTDKNVSTGKYLYRLKQIDTDGKFEYSQIIEVDLDEPLSYKLEQNYPNPFNPSTKIKFSIPGLVESHRDASLKRVVLKVYNVLGSEMTTLVNEVKPAGVYEVEFNANSLPSGVYFYKLEAGGFILTKKMILLR